MSRIADLHCWLASSSPGRVGLRVPGLLPPYGFLIKTSGLSDPAFPYDTYLIVIHLERGKAVSNNLQSVDQDSVGHCSVCGCVTELVELPGRLDRYCLECSGDVATAILLTTEIDAATLSGRDTNELVS